MKRTALFESHKSRGARFISFAGWQMPFSYKSPTLEHGQVRKIGGLFDVSHMGQIRISGKDSLSFLEKLLPSNLKSLSQGRACYSVLCSPKGGLIDDLIIYSFSEGNDYLLCVNASKTEQDLQWIRSQKKEEKLSIRDESQKWSLIAVQGPKSLELCEKVIPNINFRALSKFNFTVEDSFFVSRTGYTGEEGFEIYVCMKQALGLWETFLQEGKTFSIDAVGLGARNTLRLEMGYLLSGQDFDETKSPLQAGLSWLVKSQEQYIGRQALEKQKAEGMPSQLKAFFIKEPCPVPRRGYSIYFKDGSFAGQVTSGAKSPSLNKMIALAYIKKTNKKDKFYMESRGMKSQAELVSLPFLKKEEF